MIQFFTNGDEIEMLVGDDELGTGANSHGPFAYPEGAPIVSAEEVAHYQNRHGGKFEDCPICFPKKHSS